MSQYQTTILDNIICSKISGELDAALSSEWIDMLEKQEAENTQTLHRFYDVRDINAIHLSFDDLWGIAQRRMESYKTSEPNLSAFWVSTPLNYGVARMYQALTDGTPFKNEVFYKIEEVADFLEVDVSLLESVSF